MKDNFMIEAASARDEAALLRLLSETGLPHDGAADYLDGFFVARDGAGEIVACAGLERHGEIGLLRSVAVAPGLQKSGLGSRLVSAVIDKAKQDGIREIVLLTTTARDFFDRRFHFLETTREQYHESLQQSPEWTLPRCSSAVVMKLPL